MTWSMNMYYDLKYFTGKVRTKSPQLKKNATKYLAKFPYNPILHIAYGFLMKGDSGKNNG